MAIQKQFLFPECYVNKIPICDLCNVPLEDTNVMLASDPPYWVYKCPKCGKEYHFRESEIRGEWKWRTI